jgi:hypothetical protein
MTELDDDERAFMQAIDKAMFSLRFIAGEHPICPRCFCEAVIDGLELIGRNLEHGEPLPEIALDPIGPTEGTA